MFFLYKLRLNLKYPVILFFSYSDVPSVYEKSVIILKRLKESKKSILLSRDRYSTVNVETKKY